MAADKANQPSLPFTVQGIVVTKELRMGADKALYYGFQTNDFEVQSEDCRWLITLGTTLPKVYDYRIVSSDGSSVYFLMSYKTRLSAMNEAERRNYKGNIGDGTVARGNVPRFSFAEEAGALWISYASACYFAEEIKNPKKQVPFTVSIAQKVITPGEPAPVELAAWDVNSRTPRLPRKVTYAINNLVEAGFPVTKEFNKGQPFTNVIYEVKSFREFNGMYFPHETVTSIYRPDKVGSNTVVRLLHEFSVIETNITLNVSVQSFKPELPGKTIISEQRFNNGTDLAFAYFSDDQWPSEAAARNSDAYKSTAFALKASEVKVAARSRSPIMMFGFLLGLPILGWLVFSTKRRA